MIRGNYFWLSICCFLVFTVDRTICHEKRLRKIVRNQSKMEQKPFSSDSSAIIWKNQSLQTLKEVLASSYFPNKNLNKGSRPRLSKIIASVDVGKIKSPTTNIAESYQRTSDVRSTRTLKIEALPTSTSIPISNDSVVFEYNSYGVSKPEKLTVESYYQIPTVSKYFPSNEDRHSAEQKLDIRDNSIVIPDIPYFQKSNDSLLVTKIFVSHRTPEPDTLQKANLIDEDDVNDKVDFIMPGTPEIINPYNFNMSVSPYTCTMVNEVAADINIQEKFIHLDIEPQWIERKHYWNHIFDSRYESLMRNMKWPPLKVILVPRTHVDSIWKTSFEQYHNDSVHRILSNAVKKLHFYHNFTFSWNEISHLSHWWKTISIKTRSIFKKLLKSGRVEITTGGWVEPDEATTHLFGLLHQLMEGHHWLKNQLNFVPKVAWLTNSFTHSPTMTYLLSASGIDHLVFTNVHYAWEKFLAEFQYSDFIWQQSWDSDKTTNTHLNEKLNRIGNDRYPKYSVLSHYLQFNSAGFKSCGPNAALCVTNFDFAKPNKNLDINSYNIKEKAELMLEQYSKTGTISPHNLILVPLGGPYRYEFQPEYDYQYNNYQKLADFININKDIYKATVEFGTPKDYFKAVLERALQFPTFQGDLLNFADISTGSPAYWTGAFTSRPFFKILLRRLQSTLRSTELLFTFATSFNTLKGVNTTELIQLLSEARLNYAKLMDRNVALGTLSTKGLKYAHKLIVSSVKNCWFLQEVAVSQLTQKPGSNMHYLQKYVYRDGEFISTFKAVYPGDQIYVFNDVSYERTEIVELTTRNPNIRIIDHNKKDVTIQINPVWKYSSENMIKISKKFFKISFAIVIPGMTLELFRIKETYDTSQNAATLYCSACKIDDFSSNLNMFPFEIKSIEPGDIQLESYKHRLLFDELSGFLKTVIEKDTNHEKIVTFEYGVFRSSDVNSGMFLFNTNSTKPIQDILLPFRMGSKQKVTLITSGQITTELTTIYGKLIQNTVKIYNLVHSPLSKAIHLESKIDYEVSPKNRELELFLSIQTDINNGNSPEIYTDNNGFQYTARVLNISRRVESNIYPMTTMAYIQDNKSRLTFLTDHAQGVSALQEGNLVVMLDRRVLFNDGRGTNEGLADSTATYHRYCILLENFMETEFGNPSLKSGIKLPSMSAVYLSNSLNSVLDIFLIQKNLTGLSYFTFLPLVKTSFPCDVSVLNFRLEFVRGKKQNMPLNSALMTLHRQSFSCLINHAVNINCNGDTKFSLDKILRHVKDVFQTNLVGTDAGTVVNSLDYNNFSPMELTTLRIIF